MAHTDFPVPVLTAEAMRAADATTIDDLGVPGFTLMESAGRAAVAAMQARYGNLAGQRVTCFCGKGNNGGDGLVVARTLLAHGARVRVVVLAEAAEMSDDAAKNYRLLEAFAETLPAQITLETLNDDDLDAYAGADVFVEALLGTGLTSELREPILSLVQWLNAQPQPTVALDLPTGLHTDTGRVLGAAVTADLTVTMGALKTGLLLGAGTKHAGQVEVAEIGIPAFALEAQRQQHRGCAQRTTDAWVKRHLPTRGAEAYKYSVGLALVVAGAPDFTGAPVMASEAAARAGAGAVVCGCPASIRDLLAAKLTEVMPLALPMQDDGLHPQKAIAKLRDRLDQAKALLVGCGLGRAKPTQAFVRNLLLTTERPTVIDADGLFALDDAWLREHGTDRWLLTPHAGEFKRLAGDDADLTDRIRTAQKYAARWRVVLLLKGQPSIIAHPSGEAFVCGTGNPALATAGTGDVLAGLCVGLLAQGLAPLAAAACAAHLGGAAADRYVEQHPPHTLVATDLLAQLPHAWHAL